MGNKVVINCCYGGFNLSNKAYTWLGERYGLSVLSIDNLPRHDKRLVECVETLGRQANGECSELCVCGIEGDRYIVNDYDGFESVRTPDDIEWVVIA